MTKTPTFLIAKYAPDLTRMEPRNIGIFVWWRDEVRMKFLDPEEAAFVNEPETYERWLDFWGARISANEITPSRGKPIAKNDPACMQALATTQKGQYILVDGGELMQPVKKKEIDSVLNYLFNELVALPVAEQATLGDGPVRLQQACDSVLAKSGLASRPDFQKRYTLEVGAYGTRRRFRFSYGLGNGHPLALFQRVDLKSEQSINSAGLMVHEVTYSSLLEKDHCAMLIRESDIATDLAQEGYEWLQNLGPVIDVERADAQDQLLSRIPSANGRFGHLPPIQ